MAAAHALYKDRSLIASICDEVRRITPRYRLPS